MNFVNPRLTLLNRREFRRLALLFGTVGTFLFLSLPRLRQPLAQEDLHWFGPAESLLRQGTPRTFDNPQSVWADHPHLYLCVIAASFRLFGVNEASARLPGILTGVLSIVLIFCLIGSLSPATQAAEHWAFWCAILYAATPAVTAGSMYVMHDNTVLVPAAVLLAYAFVRFMETSTWSTGCALAVATCLNFWIRFSTPLALVLLFAAIGLIYIRTPKGKLGCAAALAAGTGLFILSWAYYCSKIGVPFAKPFAYTAEGILSRTAGEAAPLKDSQAVQSAAYMILWLGPFSVALILLAAGKRLLEFLAESKPRTEDVFLIAAGAIAAAYTLAGGAIFGYPRYQASAFPLAYIFLGLTLSRSDEGISDVSLGAAALAIAAAFAIQIGVLPDAIYLLRFALRQSAASAIGIHPTIDDLLVRGAAFAALHGILSFAFLRSAFSKKSVAYLLCLALGSNLAACWVQRNASYYVGYNYGGRGTLEAARYVASRVPAGSFVIAPDEVLFYTGGFTSKYPYVTPHSFWSNLKGLEKKLADPGTCGFVYSIVTNTVDQVRSYERDPAFVRILSRDYEPRIIGSYTVWIRKGFPNFRPARVLGP